MHQAESNHNHVATRWLQQLWYIAMSGQLQEIHHVISLFELQSSNMYHSCKLWSTRHVSYEMLLMYFIYPHENTVIYNITHCLQDNNNVHTLCRAKNGGDPWLNSTQVLCIVSVATIHMQNQTIYIDNVLHTLRYGKCIEVLFVTLLWSLPARMFRFASFVENIKKRVFLTIPKRWFVVNPPIRVRRNFLDFEGPTASKIGATPWLLEIYCFHEYDIWNDVFCVSPR